MLRCMRSTLHLIPASKHHIVTGLYNFEGCKAAEDQLNRFGMTKAEFQYISKSIIGTLTAKGPLQTQALTAAMKEGEKESAKFRVRSLTAHYGRTSVTQSSVSIALHALFGQGKIQHGLATPAPVSPTGPLLPLAHWKEPRRLHGIAALALLETASDREAVVEEGELLEGLMRWYFELYSPASLKDFVWWSGRKVRESRAALDSLLAVGELREVRVVGLVCSCYVWAPLEQNLLDTEDSFPLGARFLPYEDALIKAYKETRHRFYHLPPGAVVRDVQVPEDSLGEEEVVSNEALRELVFWKGEAHPTLWLDGQIVGRWQWRNVTEKSKPARSKAGAAPPVITVTTQRKLSKVALSRLSGEVQVLCEMLDCSPEDDVEYNVQA